MLMSTTLKSALDWIFRIAAALIMAQSLYFKFSGADESIYIFSKLGMEPWGRFGTGLIELVACGLLLTNKTVHFGAALGLGTMAGAIFFHLTVLGVEVQGDRGLLFAYAIIVLISCIVTLVLNREKLLSLTGLLRPAK